MPGPSSIACPKTAWRPISWPQKFGHRRPGHVRHIHRVDCSGGLASTSRSWRSRSLAAIAVSIPLGVIAARRPRLGPLILTTTGVIQTIPSLALLVFMIPWLGIGAKPALVALFLYSLLPIVRNTATGLRDIPVSLRESAEALGLPATARLLRIELPMASRSILAGIKTAAVINVGTATIGALIGAGGFGQPILTGIRRDDLSMILFEGAIPAALLALAVQASVRPGRAVPRSTRPRRPNRQPDTGPRSSAAGPTTRPRGEAGTRRQPPEMVERIFVRVFGMNRFALLERKLRAGDADDLRFLADQIHLHAFLRTNVVGPMRERAQVEVGAELAIDPLEHVQVKGGAHATAIVVSGPDDRFVLVEIESNEQAAAVADQPGDRAQKVCCRARTEIANRRARKIHDAPRPRVAGIGQQQRLREIAVNRQDLQSRKSPGQIDGRLLECIAGDIDRQIGSGCIELFEQQPRFQAAAAAKFDQLAIFARGIGHFTGVCLEDRQLRPRQIILVELANLVKKRRARLVVKVFTRDFFLRSAESM